MGADWIYHRASVASSNPLTTAPDIDAFYYAKVWEDGTGEHIQNSRGVFLGSTVR